MPTIALKTLLQARHMHGYSEFVAEYRRHARALGLTVVPEPPTKAHYYKWVAGQVKGLPRGPHCLVLEHMFPGWTVERLFAPSDAGIALVDEPSEELVPGLSAAVLNGLWVTVYRVEDIGCHVDLTRLTAVSGHRVTGRNWPPEPRCEKGHAGYHNEIEAEVSQRHLIGRWRNRRDSYFFGTVHLAVLPGETILDGFCTANAADVAVVAERWKWVRVSEVEIGDVDLGQLRMKPPEQVYALVQERSRLDPPLGLADVTE